MNNVMIDIETLGTKPNAVILSISAVGFDLDTGKTADIFHQNISIKSCEDAGLKIDSATFLWWLKKDKEAQERIYTSIGNPLKNVLLSFTMFLIDNFSSDVKLWGNSARFDLGLLAAAYAACNYTTPWDYYNERDVRTLVAFKPEIKEAMHFKGVKHYGVDDCKHQIKYCCEIWNYLIVE